MENNRTAINHKQGHEQIAILKKERESHLFEAKGNKKPKHDEKSRLYGSPYLFNL